MCHGGRRRRVGRPGGIYAMCSPSWVGEGWQWYYTTSLSLLPTPLPSLPPSITTSSSSSSLTPSSLLVHPLLCHSPPPPPPAAAHPPPLLPRAEDYHQDDWSGPPPVPSSRSINVVARMLLWRKEGPDLPSQAPSCGGRVKGVYRLLHLTHTPLSPSSSSLNLYPLPPSVTLAVVRRKTFV